MGALNALREALALAHDNRQDQCGRTGGNVDDGTTGKVNGCDECFPTFTAKDPAGDAAFPLAQDATAPDHVGQREVDKGCPQATEYHPGTELHTAGECTGDNRGGNNGEGELEADIDDIGVAFRTFEVITIGIKDGILEPEELEGVGNDATPGLRAVAH